MDWIVYDDCLTKVSAEAAEIFHIGSGWNLEAVLTVEPMGEILSFWIKQIDTIVCVVLLKHQEIRLLKSIERGISKNLG